MATGEEEGHGGRAWGAAVERLAQGGRQLGGAIVIEQTEELAGEDGQRFALLEGGVEEGLAFWDGDGQAPTGRRAQRLALLFEQGLEMGRIFDPLMAVVGAAVASHFGGP